MKTTKVKIRINSIFPSINGEVSGKGQGSLCTFIRFQGCNLRCSYCDTKYSQDRDAGDEWTIPRIIKVVKSYGLRNITITGGEPLLQQNGLTQLVKALQDAYRNDVSINIETNGSFPIPDMWGVVWIADWKGPSSNMYCNMKISNLVELTSKDFVKFVIADEQDFLNAIKVMKMVYRPVFVFSPVQGKRTKLQPRELVDMMLAEKVCRTNNSIFNLQIHKIIDVL